MFNEYPYRNLTDVNLDFILKHIKELEINLQDFIKLNTIKYADPIDWNISKQYEANTVVVNEFTGVAYLSTKPVPSGVDVTNTDYWTPIFTLDFVNMNKNITLRNDGNNNNATFASVTGDWLIVGGQLYKVIQDIALHTAYVVGYNIQIYSVELFVRDYLNQVLNLIGALDDLTTSDKTSIVNAINSVLSDLNDTIGDLDDLTTSDKTSVVNAINSVLSDLNDTIGDLDDLTTSDKTSVVNAINNIVSDINLLSIYVTPEMFGAVGDGVTDDTDAVNVAINSGKAVSLNKKSYKITSLITLPDNLVMFDGHLIFDNAIVTMKADGKNNILFDRVEITVAYYEGTDAHNRIDWYPLQFDNCDNVILNNCIFHCNDCRSVGFRFCTNCTVHESNFDDIEGTALTLVASNVMKVLDCNFDGTNQYDNSWHTSDCYGKLNNCDDILFEGCHYINYKGCAIQFTSTPGTWTITNARVKNCVMENWNDCGIKVDGVSSEILFESNVFDNNNYYGDAASAYPFSLGGQSGVANNVIIRNNIFRRITKGYIVSENLDATVDKLTFVGNIVYGTDARIFKMEEEGATCKELIFSDNVIEGLQFFFKMPDSYSSKTYLIFKNNKIRTFTDTFYAIFTAAYVQFTDNYIGTDISPNIHVYAGQARVENNSIVKETNYAGATYILRGPSTIVGTLVLNGNRVGSIAAGVESDVSAGTTVSYQLAT